MSVEHPSLLEPESFEQGVPHDYFRWLRDNVPHLRDDAEKGDAIFGNMDTYLIWKLTGGHVHATDVSHAARTMLFDVRHNV